MRRCCHTAPNRTRAGQHGRHAHTPLQGLRRFVDLASLIFPQSYYVDVAGQRVCLYKRRFNPFIMKLTVDFTSDTELMLDRRLGLAGAVLLCAIEGRQN